MTRRRALVALVGISASVAPVARAAAPAPTKATCAAPAAPRGEWRSYGHDYFNTRFQDAEHDIGPLEAATLGPVWTFSSQSAGGEGDFTGTPAIADGCLFVASNRGWVFALNADTGKVVWKTKLPSGGVDSSVTVSEGRVLAEVSDPGRPYLVSLDEATGALKWRSAALDTQTGSDVYGSPVVFDNMAFVGVSGGAAELADEKERNAFHGSYSLVDVTTGRVLVKTWTIPQPDWAKGFAGAAVWSTPAVDVYRKVAYVGTGNPFRPEAKHRHADAVLKVDLDRTRPTFGQIVGFYNGQLDTYTSATKPLPCVDVPGNPPPYYPQGAGSCGDLDLDFGAAPNLFFDGTGRLLVGDGQKSGVYHVFDAVTMKRAWAATVGPPSAVGGIVGSTATDGYSVYGPITAPGYLWSVDRGGAARWLAPIGDGAHYGNPVAVANGVAYTVDMRGFLDGFDTATGTPVLVRPLVLGSSTGPSPALSWGGVAVARGTVYAAVGITSLANGFVVAFRPGGGGGGGGGPLPSLPKAPVGPAIVAGPGAYASTYATPVMTTRAGGVLSFVNNDLPQHDVVAVDKGADGLPLFSSKLVGLGEVTPVNGLDRVAAGKSYAFFCTIHPGMRGTLVVVP